MVRRARAGFLLWELLLAISVLSALGWGGIYLLRGEAAGVRLQADRAQALAAASSALEDAVARGMPSPGIHPAGLGVVLSVSEEPEGGGLLLVTAAARRGKASVSLTTLAAPP